jgi:hypothetical protein
VDLERFKQLQEDQSAALQSLKIIWEKMKGADSHEVQEAIEEAIRATRKGKASAMA